MHRFVNVEGLGRLPQFSHAVVAGDTIYVSGTLGTVAGGLTLVEGGVGPETVQALHNIEAILTACGASLGDVVKVNVSMVDLTQFGAMNDAYSEVFSGAAPARITVGVAALALGAAVEIDCIAHRPSH